MVVSAIWFGLFALPVLFAVPEYRNPAAVDRGKVGFFASYARLGRDIKRLWNEQRDTVWFLLASAVFRDGLAGVFTFGGVLAASVFGFSAGEVIIFAIAANVVAGISTIAVGALDDRLGAKPVIMTALIGLVVSGLHHLLPARRRADRVLDRRPRALPLRRPRAVGEPHVPRAAHPRRAARARCSASTPRRAAP